MSVSRRPNGATARGGRRSPSTGPSQRPVPQAELGLGRRSWTALGRDATTSPQPNLRDAKARRSAREIPPSSLPASHSPGLPAHSHGGLRRGGPNRRRAACQRLGERPTRSPLELIDGRRRRSTDATGDRKNKRETAGVTVVGDSSRITAPRAGLSPCCRNNRSKTRPRPGRPRSTTNARASKRCAARTWNVVNRSAVSWTARGAASCAWGAGAASSGSARSSCELEELDTW